MSEPKKPSLASGGMSKGSGKTTVVKTTEPELDFVDKKVVCSAICRCKDAPGVGKDERSLKQVCVSTHFKELDKALKHRSVYKPEVNYDMTKEPPQPIMDSAVGTKGHDWLPGWIKKWWSDDPEHPPFRPNTGLIRRPDAVIVLDPTKPPTQDNIKQVVEIKFPPDRMDAAQRDAYAEIAGSPDKVVKIGPNECDCDAPDSKPPMVPVEDIETVSTILDILRMVITRKPTRTPPLSPAF